jgi:hypothetical protein
MASTPDFSPRQSSQAPPRGKAGRADHVVEGEITWTVRAFGLGVAGLLLLAAGLGTWGGVTAPKPGVAALVHGLLTVQAVLAGVLIMLGSVVEGFGFGLALGTKWPYTRNIVVLMLRGDPEATHRLVATAVGLIAVALAILAPGTMSFAGLAFIVATALFGIGVLYVLAGRAPAFVHGTHGLLAYGVFLVYLVGLAHPDAAMGQYFGATFVLHALLLSVFLGGFVTGQRGFGQPIGAFYTPRKPAQWLFVLHGGASLFVIGALGWVMPAYPVAFALVMIQAAAGFFLFHAVNLRPRVPGGIVAFHQAMALLIATAVVLEWP